MTIRHMPTFRNGRAHIYYTVILDGVLFYVHLDFNARDQHWYLSIYDATNAPIEGCISRKLVTNWRILIGATKPGRPMGEIYTASSDHMDPDLLELGARVLLYYVENEAA